MQNFPLVSVVVPTYNRALILKNTIRSILDQTYKNLELIIVSNGSTDNTKEIVVACNDPRIRFFEQPNSGGPASPRNKGISHSKGSYIAFCDDDDLWHHEKLEKQVNVLEENIQYGLCYTNMMRFDEKKEWFLPHEQGSADLKSLLYINTVPISSILVRRSLIEQYGGFCESKIVWHSEDYEFLLRMARKTLFYYLDMHLIKYWSGSNRTTALSHQVGIGDHWRYFKGILGCFFCAVKNKSVTTNMLFGPILYHLYRFFKSVTYTVVMSLKHLDQASR